jgi:hypothetical protein
MTLNTYLISFEYNFIWKMEFGDIYIYIYISHNPSFLTKQFIFYRLNIHYL